MPYSVLPQAAPNLETQSISVRLKPCQKRSRRIPASLILNASLKISTKRFILGIPFPYKGISITTLKFMRKTISTARWSQCGLTQYLAPCLGGADAIMGSVVFCLLVYFPHTISMNAILIHGYNLVLYSLPYLLTVVLCKPCFLQLHWTKGCSRRLHVWTSQLSRIRADHALQKAWIDPAHYRGFG